MSLEFSCEQCGKRFRVSEEHAGKKGKCSCGAVLEIPDSSMDRLGEAESAGKSATRAKSVFRARTLILCGIGGVLILVGLWARWQIEQPKVLRTWRALTYDGGSFGRVERPKDATQVILILKVSIPEEKWEPYMKAAHVVASDREYKSCASMYASAGGRHTGTFLFFAVPQHESEVSLCFPDGVQIAVRADGPIQDVLRSHDLR